MTESLSASNMLFSQMLTDHQDMTHRTNPGPVLKFSENSARTWKDNRNAMCQAQVNWMAISDLQRQHLFFPTKRADGKNGEDG